MPVYWTLNHRVSKSSRRYCAPEISLPSGIRAPAPVDLGRALRLTGAPENRRRRNTAPLATTPHSAIGPLPIPPDTTEEQLIRLWLHGKTENTIRAYRQDIAAFRAFIGKPIRLAYLGDLQRYVDAPDRLAGVCRASAARREVAALVCCSDGLHAIQRWRRHPATPTRRPARRAYPR